MWRCAVTKDISTHIHTPSSLSSSYHCPQPDSLKKKLAKLRKNVGLGPLASSSTGAAPVYKEAVRTDIVGGGGSFGLGKKALGVRYNPSRNSVSGDISGGIGESGKRPDGSRDDRGKGQGSGSANITRSGIKQEEGGKEKGIKENGLNEDTSSFASSSFSAPSPFLFSATSLPFAPSASSFSSFSMPPPFRRTELSKGGSEMYTKGKADRLYRAVKLYMSLR